MASQKIIKLHPFKPPDMKTFLKITGAVFLIVVAGFIILILTNLKDRNPGYKADMSILTNEPNELKAGFAAVPITPEVPDRWTDVNNDAVFNTKDGDTFTDGNGNGKFDPVWIAGFSNARAANGIHDDLWARSMVIDDGKTRIAIVALDAIGFMNVDVVDVRNLIPPSAGITYTIIASTHTHEGPDLLGLWGETSLKCGINAKYMQFVKSQIVKSVETAAASMKPATLSVSEDLSGAQFLVKDTREPAIFDTGLRIIRALDRETGKTLGSLIAWADHPETLWSKNLLLSSDFPHFVREGVEKGVFNGDTLVKPGIGGIALYINGALGGLMTTHPSLAVKDPFTGFEYNEPSFGKAEAQGKQLALLILKSMENPSEEISSAAISLVVKSFRMPIDNKMFRFATAAGVLNRGTAGWMKMRTEISAFNLGPVSFATIPGEAYPEILNGPIEAPEGNDFKITPVELPVVRDLMKGKYKFIFCLANDEIGYILPKSQWDEHEPFTYGRKDSPYGEENSLGPETASILHKNLEEILGKLN
jgi:hypothetical protein